MDNLYLQELISETNNRGGGLILSMQDKPAVVVLTVDRYNQIINLVSSGVGDSAGQSPAATNFTQTNQANNFMPKKKILVTGGAGYIGSHAARQLLKSGYEVVVLDNLSAGKRKNVPEAAKFVEGDLSDVSLLNDLFAGEKFEAVMHFAASIEVEESVQKPEAYFENNVINTARLLAVMAEHNVKNIIFSSTCAVYGEQATMPINEQAKVAPVNPYGYSKLIAERVIKYYCEFVGLNAVVFRYFNACGCDFDADIELTHKTHLLANVMDVAVGKKPSITVFGKDYETFDGTCIRDYVHVLDIAGAHIAALANMGDKTGYRVYNIGTGKGSSVLEIINKTAEILNKIIPMETGQKRAGDAAILIADNSKLKNELHYNLQYSDLDTIISTSWAQAKNYH